MEKKNILPSRNSERETKPKGRKTLEFGSNGARGRGPGVLFMNFKDTH